MTAPVPVGFKQLTSYPETLPDTLRPQGIVEVRDFGSHRQLAIREPGGLFSFDGEGRTYRQVNESHAEIQASLVTAFGGIDRSGEARLEAIIDATRERLAKALRPGLSTEDAIPSLDELLAEAITAIDARDRAVGLLAKHEWCSPIDLSSDATPEIFFGCPECDGFKPGEEQRAHERTGSEEVYRERIGHTPDCALDALFSKGGSK